MKTLHFAIIAVLIFFASMSIIPFVRAEIQPSCSQEITVPFQDNSSAYTKKAISLAENDSQFIQNKGNSTFKFYAIYGQWWFEAKKCNNFDWYNLNVVFQRQDNLLPKYIVAMEDPQLTIVNTIANIWDGAPKFQSNRVQGVPQGSEPIGMSAYVGEGVPKVDATPLQQVRAGLWGQDVTCRDDLTLIFSKQDRSVACVKPVSLPRLESIGWLKYNHTVVYDRYIWCPDSSVSARDDRIVVACNHVQNQSSGIFNLPAPAYQLYPCTGGYGCSFEYAYRAENNTALLDTLQKQQVIDRIMSLPNFNSSSDWAVDHFITYPRADLWFADVQLFHSIGGQTCGRYAQVGVDLQNLSILYIVNSNETSFAGCINK